MRHLLLAAALVFSAPLLAAQQARAATNPPKLPRRMLVSGFESDAVHAYRQSNGAPLGLVAARGAQCTFLGPDGLLYVCAEEVDQVLRYRPDTLALVDIFVGDDPLTPADENGSLNGPTAASFGPDGGLYVASFENDRILRFDGQTGAYDRVFVTAGLGGLNGPDAGTKWGSDGLLYVPSFFGDSVLRYDAGGAFVDAFVAAGEGTCRQPRDLVEHGGLWYVASSQNNRILRYDLSGNFVDQFASVPRPYSLAFQPDSGELYVVSLGGNDVRILDGTTGAPLGTAVAAGSAGLLGAVYISFLP